MWGDSLNFGNGYGYAGFNPVMLRDLHGLWGWDFLAGAIDGAISGATFGLVETTVGADMLGVDTNSAAYTAVDVATGEQSLTDVGINAVKGKVAGKVAGKAAKATTGAAAKVKNRKKSKSKSSEEKPACSDVEGGECFIAGTPVLTSFGAIAIESLQVGDRVLTSPEGYQDSSTRVDEKTWLLSASSWQAPPSKVNT